MMILLSDAGKRFNHEWIFRHFTYRFETGNSYAITGHNGSGKSTLLQVIGGSMLMNEGTIEWNYKNKNVSTENIYAQVSICAPYLDVIEEMTLREFLQFHQTFKPFIHNITTEQIIALLGLERAADKQIRYYSSGMRQRAKLAQCIFSDTAIVLLDEPCTNLDEEGINLYHRLINDYCSGRLVIVSSNDKTEYSFCNEMIAIGDYKKQ